jgi:hypothetical protein
VTTAETPQAACLLSSALPYLHVLLTSAQKMAGVMAQQDLLDSDELAYSLPLFTQVRYCSRSRFVCLAITNSVGLVGLRAFGIGVGFGRTAWRIRCLYSRRVVKSSLIRLVGLASNVLLPLSSLSSSS